MTGVLSRDKSKILCTRLNLKLSLGTWCGASGHVTRGLRSDSTLKRSCITLLYNNQIKNIRTLFFSRFQIKSPLILLILAKSIVQTATRSILWLSCAINRKQDDIIWISCRLVNIRSSSNVICDQLTYCNYDYNFFYNRKYRNHLDKLLERFYFIWVPKWNWSALVFKRVTNFKRRFYLGAELKLNCIRLREGT